MLSPLTSTLKVVFRVTLLVWVSAMPVFAGPDNMPSQSQVIHSEPFHIEINRTGRIDFRYITNLSFKTPGFVDILYADSGQRIYAGDTIATIELTDLMATKSSITARHQKSQQDLQRARQLYREKTVSKDFLEQAETDAVQAQSEMEQIDYDINKATIIVPFDAVVVSRLVQPGEQVSSGSPVFSVASTDAKNLVVRLNLTQNEISQVELQMPVVISTPEQQTFNGKIIAISAIADASTGLYEVEIAVDFDQRRALPGQWVQASIGVTRQQPSYRIPIVALAAVTNGEASFVIDSGNGYELRQFPIIHMDQQSIYIPATDNQIRVVTRGWDRLLNQLEQ
ncbi:hypothetical protein GCM10011369_28290 [Neiella marina]|uniref:CzcB-like barrel-sandwich hybrid domain-containing protein n=1 Tax=Neiella marina TaxID=508461 RepID=A0A8J2U7S1_9GAMM|nr:efflux RND transporter periplasmic adaptor subunit [Neiella marina]GGA84580.1 hypothetical protein GCM10011369_28290 [Neiella marina]